MTTLARAEPVSVVVDLTVAAVLLNAFVLRDARASGRNAWPYVIGTLLLGSFSPLLYFVVGAFWPGPPRAPRDGP